MLKPSSITPLPQPWSTEKLSSKKPFLDAKKAQDQGSKYNIMKMALHFVIFLIKKP